MPLGGYLRTRGVKDGLFDGRRLWLAIGLVMWTGRILKKVLVRPSEVISLERLKPGESLLVSAHAAQDSPAQARRSRRRTSATS